MSGNKKISQLTELLASDVIGSDLLAIVDVPNRETKKITVNNLSVFLNNSGSLFAIHSTTSDTASYVLGNNVYGLIASSSYALKSINSDSASYASNALSAASASLARTASFAINGGGGNALITGSLVPITASWTNNTNVSKTASFLLYSGGNNGTASFAIKAQSSITSDTASFLLGVTSITTASYAISASNAVQSNSSVSSSFLNWQPGSNTGTASYALIAGANANFIQNFGVFLPNTQSSYIAQLDNVSVPSVFGNLVYTSVSAIGTIIVPYTSSIPVNESITLAIQDRNTGITSTIDSTPIYFSLSPTVGTWDIYDTGSIKIPYTLLGSQSLNGNYLVYITASSTKISIEPTRLTRFNLSSLNNVLTVQPDAPLMFTVSPSTTLINFSSSLGGPFKDTYLNINNITGSSNVLAVDVNSGSITSIKYVWKLNNLTTFKASSNPSLFSIVGNMPSTLTWFECYSSSLSSLPSLATTTMSYINCNNNNIFSIQNICPTMSYSSSFDCSNNPLVNVSVPFGLGTFKCDNTAVSITPTFPDTIVSMSMASNASLISFVSSLPRSLVHLNVNNSPVSSLPALPISTSIIHAMSASLTTSAMDTICSQSYSNGQISGSLDISGNGQPLPSTVATYINNLIFNRGWSVMYDS